MKRFFIRFLFLALVFGFIGLNVTRAQDAKVPSGWKKVDVCDITFIIPDKLKPEDAGGVSSTCAGASFHGGKMWLGIDSGFNGSPTTKSETYEDFTEESIQIDGKKAQFATYKQPKANAKPDYIARIYLVLDDPKEGDEEPLMSFSMTLVAQKKKDLEKAKQIFQSIRFNK